MVKNWLLGVFFRISVIDLHGIESSEMNIQPFAKFFPGTVCCRFPQLFGKGSQTGKEHIVKMRLIRNERTRKFQNNISGGG